MFLIAMIAAVGCAVFVNGASVNICDGVANYMFLTDITNCTNYYICYNGDPILEACQNGTYFDASIQSCVTTNTHCLSCAPNNLTVSALQRTCNKYVICFNGEPIVEQCCDDLQYNTATDQCDFPQVVNCVDCNCAVDPSSTEIVYVPSLDSCNSYYICMNGQLISHTCAANLTFNPDCNCCSTNNTCALTTKTISKKYFARSMLGLDFLPAAQTGSASSRPTFVDIDCPRLGVHFLAKPNNNQQYYMCLNGKGALFDCANGLYFDERVSACRTIDRYSRHGPKPK